MPRRTVPPRNRAFAKAMRQKMTTPELRLWLRLKKPGVPGLRFRRQTPIGPYIVDFFCPEGGLVVEVDGDQHGLAVGEHHDSVRDAWLRAKGYRVLRFTNQEVMTNLEGICETILAARTRDR